MPHAVSMPQTGFQALILCGPGVGLTTFTSVPKEYPKALISIANRPMVWYVLDWCYRTGVTDITLVTPPESEPALSAALSQNPYLTSLPSPSATILAPADLKHEMGTAELLRLPEVQQCIKSDFFLLPCDLICDVAGETLLETWMTSMGGLGGVTDGSSLEVFGPKMLGPGGEKGGRRGGLSVYYPTTHREESVKKEECDFVCTTQLDRNSAAAITGVSDTQGSIRKLVWATPMSSLEDDIEENKSWTVRSSLLQRYGFVKCLTTFRDAHIYLFPYWVKDFAKLNDDFESVSEDLVGTWAKAEWRKPSYRSKFNVKEVFNKPRAATTKLTDYYEIPIEEELDLLSLSSTQTTRHTHVKSNSKRDPVSFASRVSGVGGDSPIEADSSPDDIPIVPPMLAYLHNSKPSAPIIRRVDTVPLLLSVSLLLAKLPPTESGTTSSALSHPQKIHPTATIAARTTISNTDTLIGANASVAEKCVIKESIVGHSASIGQGSRLTRCIIMDGAVIGEKCMLTNTVIGKKAVIGPGCDLRDCEVQDGMGVGVRKEGEDDAAVEAKNEKFMIGGFEDDAEDFDDEYMTGDQEEF
ncbi:putative eukaryotic translation initiation factor subunit eif2b [Phaeomoniella chlamydospora]|uniref:Translation initiation factor eIF2B subunit gamma n=1 Tax=Phaeomoniella chlamydospora TaxID=158046 RepID=A0A0G2DXP0_PHACM|nr:putative eukaryotic translation initiation factor subunit eif2b [Phaeomoniella chlamydospora]